MYKIDVEYLRIDNKFGATIYCSECDKNSTTSIFRIRIPSPDGMVGHEKYINMDHITVNIKDTIEEVENEVKDIVNKLREKIEKSRSDVIKKEEYEI